MAQYPKDEVRDRIVDAALAVFAEEGYGAATIARIAAAAGVSTGNVYRYFENKRALFDAALPEAFPRQLLALVRARVEALQGVDDVRTLGPEARYRAISEELLRFAIENRLRVVLLLGKADGTEYERYPDTIMRELVRQALAWAASIRAPAPSAAAHFALEQIYRNFVEALARILARYQREASIREAVEALSTYHLAGLRAFFLEEAK